MECSSAIKRNAALTPAMTRMSLESTILRGGHKGHTVDGSTYVKYPELGNAETEFRRVSSRNWGRTGGRGHGRHCLPDTGFFGGYENVLELEECLSNPLNILNASELFKMAKLRLHQFYLKKKKQKNRL